MDAETSNKSERKHEDFAAAAEPLIEWLNKFGHPSMKVIVENDGAEVVEGCMSHRTEEFLRD